MKKMFARVMSVALAVVSLAVMTSCGDKQAEKQKALDEAAEALSTELASVTAPLSHESTLVADNDIVVKMTVSDSMIDVSRLGDELMDYYMAMKLKQGPSELINKVVKAVEGSEGSVKLDLTDIYGNSTSYSFSGETIRHLIKAKGSALNEPRVKEQVARLLEKALPNAAAYADADNVALTFNRGFLSYEVTFPNDRGFAKSTQGLITKQYMQPVKAQYAALGSMQADVIELLKNLRVDGVSVTYKALNSDKELKQAFPWRVILE